MSRYVYGVRPVLELLRARPGEVLAVYRGDRDAGHEIVALAQAAGVRVGQEDKRRLDYLAGTPDHQGFVAQARDFPYAEYADLLGAWENDAGRLYLYIDGVQDPRNLGSLIRSAAALGASGVVIPKDKAAPVTPVVGKASAGAIEHIPIARVSNLVRALEEAKKAGAWVIGAASEGGKPPAEIDFAGRVALVVGSEGQGMRRLTAKTCDFLITLPMAGPVASLNAGVAGGIVLYLAMQGRGARTPMQLPARSGVE